jgi:hypothetical protein
MAELKDGKAAENAKENPVVEEVIGGGEPTNEDKGVVVSKIKTNKQVVAELLAKGCNKIAGIRVRSSIVTSKDNYVMVSLSLERGIPGYVSDGEGVFTKGETATVFTSSYSIASVLKDNDETAWAANQLIQNPKGLEVILAGAKVDFVQEEVAADEIYKNPFSSSDVDGQSLGHDTIINHVVKIEICQKAKQMLNMLAMNMMGIGGF